MSAQSAPETTSVKLADTTAVRFFSRYNKLMIAAVSIIATLSFGMLWLQRESGKELAHARIVDGLRLQALGLDALLKDATNHVELMQTQAQNQLLGQGGSESAEILFRSMQNIPAKSIFALDQVPFPYKETDTGNLTGLGTIPFWDNGFRQEAIMALSLNPMFQATRKNIPSAAWVYYTSARKFITIFPYTHSNDFAMKEDLLTHEFFTLGMPEKNPNRKIFWTSAYIDEAGKGVMVTCGKPVDHGSQFLGTVAIDLTLDFLNQFVTNPEDGSGTAFIVNDSNQLLAHPMLVSSKDKEIKLLKDALPEALTHEKLFQGKPLEIKRSGGEIYTYQRLKNAPWNMVLVMTRRTMMERAFSGFAVIFFILLAGFALLFIITSRVVYSEFIRPASKLVAFIQNTDNQIDVGVSANTPTAWKPWFDTVSSIFKNNRELLQNLEEKVQERTTEITRAKEESDRLLKVIRHDLNLARKVQENMMSPINDSVHFRITTLYKPQSEVGGDLYDIHYVRPDFLRVFIADATGHGVQAALVTMAIKADYENLKKLDVPVGSLLAFMNQQFFAKYGGINSFFSCALVDVDLAKEEIHYASAGHPQQILLNASGVTRMQGTGRLIGIAEDTTYSTIRASFDRNARLCLFTDGATEQFKDGIEFGEERFIELLAKNKNSPIEASPQRILAELETFMAGSDRQDDLTLILVEARRSTEEKVVENSVTDFRV